MAAPRTMALPFAIDTLGRVAFTEDPTQQVRDQVRTVVSTRLFERVMRPRYGVDLQAYLFGYSDNRELSQLRIEIEAALALWMPSVTVVAVVPEETSSEGVLAVRLDYTIPSTTPQDNTLYSAVIEIGGSVVSA